MPKLAWRYGYIYAMILRLKCFTVAVFSCKERNGYKAMKSLFKRIFNTTYDDDYHMAHEKPAQQSAKTDELSTSK